MFLSDFKYWFRKCLFVVILYHSWIALAALTVEPIKKNVDVIMGIGGNIGLLKSTNGIIIIDNGLQRNNKQLLQFLQKHYQKLPQFVFNTHYHGDHLGNNALFQSESVIIAHSNVINRLQLNKEAPAKLPNLGYQQQLRLLFGVFDLKVKHFANGHTDGDSVVYLSKSNIVHMGDLFFNERFPFIDLNGGGNVLGFVANVKEIRDSIDANTIVIPGHGAVTNLAGLNRYIAMLDASVATVRQFKQKKMTLQQMVATGLPKQWANWSWQFISEERWITTLYNDL